VDGDTDTSIGSLTPLTPLRLRSLHTTTQPRAQDGGPSREDLLEEVHRLREQIQIGDIAPPPEYSG